MKHFCGSSRLSWVALVQNVSASSTLWQSHTVINAAHVCACVYSLCDAEDRSQSLVLANVGAALLACCLHVGHPEVQIECLGLTSGDPEFIDLSRSQA